MSSPDEVVAYRYSQLFATNSYASVEGRETSGVQGWEFGSGGGGGGVKGTILGDVALSSGN